MKATSVYSVYIFSFLLAPKKKQVDLIWKKCPNIGVPEDPAKSGSA
jgi:hypothetical protein